MCRRALSIDSQPYAGIITRAVAFAIDMAILQGGLLIAGIVVGLIVEAFGDFSPDVIRFRSRACGDRLVLAVHRLLRHVLVTHRPDAWNACTGDKGDDRRERASHAAPLALARRLP